MEFMRVIKNETAIVLEIRSLHKHNFLSIRSRTDGTINGNVYILPMIDSISVWIGTLFILNIFIEANHIITTKIVLPKYQNKRCAKLKKAKPSINNAPNITILITFKIKNEMNANKSALR